MDISISLGGYLDLFDKPKYNKECGWDACELPLGGFFFGFGFPLSSGGNFHFQLSPCFGELVIESGSLCAQSGGRLVIIVQLGKFQIFGHPCKAVAELLHLCPGICNRFGNIQAGEG